MGDGLSIPAPQRAASAFQVREEREHVNGAGLFQSNFYQCSAAWGIDASYVLSLIVNIYSNLAYWETNKSS